MSKNTSHQSSDIHPKIIYKPKPHENELVRFRKYVEKKYHITLNDYGDLHEWSCKKFPDFWECVWQYYDVIHSQPYTEVFDKSKSFTHVNWFKGARLNYAENIFRYRDDRTAIIAMDDADNVEYVTYKQMYEEVCLYAAAMRDLGIRKEDVVTCYMSNKKEAVFAFLAAASIGALWCGALPLLGVKAVLARFDQTKAKILFTSGRFCFEGKEIEMKQKIVEIVSSMPSFEKVVYVPSQIKGTKENIEEIPKCCFLNEFLDPWRKEFQHIPWELEFEQLPFDHPVCVNFTSGTTGLPKGILHCIGTLLIPLRDFGLHLSCTRDDVVFSFSPVGWISWHLFVSCLHLGMSVCLYEGDVFDKSPTRFWDIVDRFGLSTVFLWSSIIESMQLNGQLPTSNHNLKSLKQLFGIGSPLKNHCYEFIAEKLKPGLFCGSVYGMTEFFGMLSGVDSNLPVRKGELQCFALGFDFRCVDEKGEIAVGKRGDLVLASPFPAVTGLLNDKNNQKLIDTYLSKYPGFWYIGDDVWINPETKGLIVYGRSDETLNPKGARFNCAEIYFALGGFPGLLDSVCVSHYNKNLDERVILFVKMAPGHTLTPEVEEKIRKTIEENLTYEHVPDIIMEAPDIPYNLTGKKLNGLVKKLINKQHISNTEIVINPASTEFFKNLDLGDF